MTIPIDIANPLFHTRAERLRIATVLRHLGSGADLRDFPGTASEKTALVKTANQRGLIAWNKPRGRYELTPDGWCELAPSRRFGVGSIMLGTTVGASLGAAVLAVFWFTAGVAHRPPAPRAVVAAAATQVAKAPVPAPVSSPAPAAPTPNAAAQAPAPATPAAAPAAAAEPPSVAYEPTPEQRAEAAARAKHEARKQAAARRQAAAANREKARQRAAARRKREEAARNWAANGPRGRQAGFSSNGGYGGNGFGGYGGQNPWNAYR